MENERYMQGGVDLKKLFLRFTAKLWLVALAAALGAVLGAGIYLLGHLVFAPQQEYQAVSKIYLNFNCDPKDYGELAYNGYTWNDLMTTDPILNRTMEELPEHMERETVIQATKAEILSDIRLLTVTITTADPDLTAQIMRATQESLIRLGQTDELFRSIEIYSTEGPERIVWDNRSVRAAATGMVIALFLTLFVMLLYYVLDDSIYVEADVEKNYGLPVIGIFTASEPGTFQSYGSEFLANYSWLCRGCKTVSLLGVDSAGDAEKAVQTMEKIQSTGRMSEGIVNLPMSMPQDDASVYEEIRRTDGVIPVVRYGQGNGRRLERDIAGLKKQDCRILGVLIVEADGRFLKKYYAKKRAGKV